MLVPGSVRSFPGRCIVNIKGGQQEEGHIRQSEGEVKFCAFGSQLINSKALRTQNTAILGPKTLNPEPQALNHKRILGYFVPEGDRLKVLGFRT